MRQLLTRHPATPCAAVDRIEVEVVRPRPDGLALRYILIGEAGGLRLPSAAPAERTDGLWRHTCFEAFVGADAAAAYCEFNFAPSTQWAAYRFDGYRQGMTPAHLARPPVIETRRTAEGLELLASLDPVPTALAGEGARRLGLSAVVEEADGRISYWALAHPPGKADFHHPDCFALELPATGRQ
jgi:hypothetical protein